MRWMMAARIACVGLVLAAAPACASEVRVGFSQDALTLDPAGSRNRETETIIRNMCDGVLTQTSGGEVVPELASSFTQISPTVYEAKLRHGVKFHSGEEMTAEDVKFTFDRLTKPGALGGHTSPRKDLLGPLAETQVVDRYTVRFVLSKPWPVFPRMLPVEEVVSKAFVEAHGSDYLTDHVDCTGPFRLVEWHRGESIVMARFADYYGGAPAIPPVGPARVDRVIFQIVPENASRIAGLLAGQLDIINELPITAIPQIDHSGSARVLKTNGTRTFFIALNVTRPPFNDVRVRRAANHAVNKALLIAKLLQGTATPVAGVLSPESFGAAPGLTSYDYSPDQAKALMAESGHADGFDVTLDTEGAYKDTAEAIASMLTKAGIRAKVRVWEGAVLAPLWRKDVKDRDMMLGSWGSAALDPTGIFVPTLQTGGRGNAAGYSNAEVDRLLTAAETETDSAKRAAMYHQAELIVSNDAPWIFLWVPQDIYAVRNGVTGWAPAPSGRINLHRVQVVH